MTASKNTSGVLKTILLACAAVVAVAALLILVPSSPALLVDEYVTLLEIPTGGVDEWGDPRLLLVTGYSVCIAAGAALAIAAVAFHYAKKGGSVADGLALALCSGVCALLGSHWTYCAVRWGYIINDLGGAVTFPLEFWQGGNTMYGAIFGGLLGALLWALAKKQRIAHVMDVIVPGLLILLTVGRYGEALTSQGMANIRAAEALHMLPEASVGEWGDPVLPVYKYEAVVALVALLFVSVMLWKKEAPGSAAEYGLIFISGFQLLFESMRGDELIKFGFVCLNMIMAAAVLVFIYVRHIVLSVRAKEWVQWKGIAGIAVFLIGIAIVIATEFALDGKIQLPVSNTVLYAVDFVAVLMIMTPIMNLGMEPKEGEGV